MIAISDTNEKRIGHAHRIDLYVDVNFNESTVLLIGIGDQMNSRYVTEWGLVIRVDLLHLESVFKYLLLHVDNYTSSIEFENIRLMANLKRDNI